MGKPATLACHTKGDFPTIWTRGAHFFLRNAEGILRTRELVPCTFPINERCLCSGYIALFLDGFQCFDPSLKKATAAIPVMNSEIPFCSHWGGS